MINADHGRTDTRSAIISTDIGWLQEAHAWPGLAAIGKAVRTRQAAGTTTSETT